MAATFPVRAHRLQHWLSLGAVALLLAGCRHGPSTADREQARNFAPLLVDAKHAPRLAPPPQADIERVELDQLEFARRELSPETRAAAEFWSAGATIRWNEIVRNLIARHRSDHPMAARVLALVSVAQYDALVVAWRHMDNFRRRRPAQVSRELAPLWPEADLPSYPDDQAAVATASAAVLSHLFPGEGGYLERRAAEQLEVRQSSGARFPSDVHAGAEIGRAVAAIVIARAESDGAESATTPSFEPRPGAWSSAANRAPVRPLWGSAKPWLMATSSIFRPRPPPPPGSREFQVALDEVAKFSRTRTPEQARIAALWADGPGSYTPPGRWNKIAIDILRDEGRSEFQIARVLAFLNMALFDASVACWDAKYHYRSIRPSQADPSITTPVGLPNFPSYPSAHSAFSAAAAGVLGYFSPERQKWLDEKAAEASISRLYGGIHFRFDLEGGAWQGRQIAKLAVELARSNGSR
jgi:membrane-associated phospholipid phosphatase